MRLEPYSYELPPHLIAQRPVYPYDAARLLVVRREQGELLDARFLEIEQYLNAGDLLVFNDSRVMQARLFAELEGTHAKIEVLVLEERGPGLWRCLARPLRRLSEGKRVRFSEMLSAQVVRREGQDRVDLAFFNPQQAPANRAEIEAQACMPIPPYIRAGRADAQDSLDYQATFARESPHLVGASVAAPTAGLHFTPALRAQLLAQGLRLAQLTLHVGSASFQPVLRKGGQPTAPGEERYLVPSALLEEMAACRAAGAKVVAVGTTVARALESCFAEGAALSGREASTRLFISPGFAFKAIDCLVTNFHQPNTTHLLLVEALLGRELLDRAYTHALLQQYRFLSYGDGMLIC